jgi:MOSC domain-containing protein
MGTVLECWRYPVKSAAGEAVGRLTAVSGGVLGDRRWAVMDGDGTVVSAKHPARGGRLLQVATAYDDDTSQVRVLVPGHPAHPAGSTAAAAALSRWLGRPVTLADTVPDGLRLHRLWPADQGMVPDWEAGVRPGQEAVTRVNGAAGRRFVDYGAVHLVTTGALDRLARVHGCTVPAVRFRPNLLLDLPADPAPGDVLTVGEATLRVDLPTPRCIVPSLPQPGAGQPDTRLLSTLARHHREQVPGYGRAAVFGCYAVIEVPGRIKSGAAVAILGPKG